MVGLHFYIFENTTWPTSFSSSLFLSGQSCSPTVAFLFFFFLFTSLHPDTLLLRCFVLRISQACLQHISRTNFWPRHLRFMSVPTSSPSSNSALQNRSSSFSSITQLHCKSPTSFPYWLPDLLFSPLAVTKSWHHPQRFRTNASFFDFVDAFVSLLKTVQICVSPSPDPFRSFTLFNLLSIPRCFLWHRRMLNSSSACSTFSPYSSSPLRV